MPRIDLHEDEETEFKRSWADHALDALAAFANTRGGTVVLGVEDDGEVIGLSDPEGEIQKAANSVTAKLGVTPSISGRVIEGREIVEVCVAKTGWPVALDGRYLVRAGSTNRVLTNEELGQLMLRRSGQSWDALASSVDLDQINAIALERFAGLARQRFPLIDPTHGTLALQNLGLLRDGKLTNAAVLLFAERPQEIFPGARLRIGVFKGNQIVDAHEFEGTLWDQLESGMEQLQRLLKMGLDVQVTGPTLEGLRNREAWEYPLEALREALINALIHRDYSASGDVQIRILDDSLQIWNPGGLPEGIDVEQLREPNHPSVPRNPLIAHTFYSAGLIERWGTGTTRILAACADAGLPEAEFHGESGAFQVVFLKDLYSVERLHAMGLNDRQVKAVLFVKQHGSVTNREYQDLTASSKRTASRDLEDLVSRDVLERVGQTGRGTQYVIRGQKGAKGATKGPETGQRGHEDR
jgi:ATP-dependent DNA helicase RecG